MILENLFRLMSEHKASDVFITAGTPIHIKIHGQSRPANTQVITPAMAETMVKDLMSEDQWAEFQHKREFNMSTSMPGVGNFRINVFQQRNSVAMVIRFISGEIPPLNSLGVPKILGDLAMETRGLILVVGATGSGKSTTLASMIDHRATEKSGHILTIEDPIEFLFRHKKSIINQREIGIDTDDWHVALKNAMRQAPDCIFIGEIRDKETMGAALAYSQSGHLVMATLHANNSYHALNRITNFFPLESRDSMFLDLSISLRAIISQRLVKKVDGGRSPAMEVLINTRAIADLMEKGNVPEIKEAMEKSLAPGCQTFEQSLFQLVQSGIITLDTALDAADSQTNLHWLIHNSGFDAKKAETEKAVTNAPAASFENFTLQMNDD